MGRKAKRGETYDVWIDRSPGKTILEEQFAEHLEDWDGPLVLQFFWIDDHKYGGWKLDDGRIAPVVIKSHLELTSEIPHPLSFWTDFADKYGYSYSDINIL